MVPGGQVWGTRLALEGSVLAQVAKAAILKGCRLAIGLVGVKDSASVGAGDRDPSNRIWVESEQVASGGAGTSCNMGKPQDGDGLV